MDVSVSSGPGGRRYLADVGRAVPELLIRRSWVAMHAKPLEEPCDAQDVMRQMLAVLRMAAR